MIYVCSPKLGGNELKYVEDCVKTNWISSVGKYVTEFEDKFSSFCDSKYGVAVCNGTVAIHLALVALGIGRGDEVIIPSFTMIATINAVLYSGAKPVLVDSEISTWNIDPEKIEEKITDKTKAIIPVHTYGHPADMDRINDVAKKHNLYVIEDAAEAHGALYKDKKAGSLGDIGCFSFYANKILTTGEGGMLVTDDEKISLKAKFLRNQALSNEKRRFMHEEMGFNYRLTNLQAAVGLAQTEQADFLVQKRIDNAKKYNELLKDIPGIVLPPQAEWAKNVYWMYSVLIDDDFGMDAETVQKELKEKGVDTRPFFYPMHLQPMFKLKEDAQFPDTSGEYPIAEELSRKGINLPSSPELTDDEIKTVADALISLRK